MIRDSGLLFGATLYTWGAVTLLRWAQNHAAIPEV